MPDYAKKYIASWRKYLPGYEIKEWNEDNFDVNIIPYTREAYKAKKYAFVSDYARFWILYHYGGVYFDTDVEVIRNMDDIVLKGPFMGIENLATEDKYETVGAGLGLGAEKGMDFYKRVLDNYAGYHFIMPDGSLNLRTVVQYVTVELARCGLKRSNDLQLCAGIYIYPKDYFNPKGGDVMRITPNTRTIHQYSASWVDGKEGVVDVNRLGFKIRKAKEGLKHFLKKFTLLKRNRLVISNNYLSYWFKGTYSLKTASPFDGGWISDEDFVHVRSMLDDLKNGDYDFINKEDSKYASKLTYDYPILKLRTSEAEVHFEKVDCEEDVRYKINNSISRIENGNVLFAFFTNDAEKARIFRENIPEGVIVSSLIPQCDYEVGDINEYNKQSATTKAFCRKLANY